MAEKPFRLCKAAAAGEEMGDEYRLGGVGMGILVQESPCDPWPWILRRLRSERFPFFPLSPDKGVKFLI